MKYRGKISKELKNNLAASLRNGAVGIFPTDTIYGIVTSAFSAQGVHRVYRLRKRNPRKPFIILISSPRDLAKFGVQPSNRQKKIMNIVWPGPTSLIFAMSHGKFDYLTRGESSLAFRVPGPVWLRDFLSASGPLVAPSANWEGEKPSRNIREAKKYFGDKVDFYTSRGNLISAPSTLVSLVGEPRVLREGASNLKGLIK
jgi:L-threonylcarbamoyladenylate synthase